MAKDNVNLDVGSKIKLKEDIFIVKGYIVFRDNDGLCWVEYKIKSKSTSDIKWLSIDRINQEYSVYKEQDYDKSFSEENIISQGYKKVEDDVATVVDYKGDVDVDLDETVYYKEYEDSTEEKLISVEEWNGLYECSKGYYVDKEEIENIGFQSQNNLSRPEYINRKGSYNKNKPMNILAVVVGIICIIIAALGIKSCVAKKLISDVIKSNTDFQYVTSITSDLDNNKKADVYLCKGTVEYATKTIIEGLNGDVEDVQENTEDGTVVISVSDELAVIYNSEDGETMLQLSDRKYAYSSRNTMYRSSTRSNRFFRRYYYSKFFNRDRERFDSSKSGYANYNGGSFSGNDNNKYKSYSDSIRQQSINSRTSSGGGTSAGK